MITLTPEQIETVTRLYVAQPFTGDLKWAFSAAGLDYSQTDYASITAIEESAECDDRCRMCGQLIDGDDDDYCALCESKSVYYGEAV